jgi:hypothetical protein
MNSKLRVWQIVTTLFLFCVGRVGMLHAAPPTDACSLLTPAQVSAVLSVEVIREGSAGHPTLCEWSQPGKTLGGKRVLLNIVEPMGTLTPAQRFETIKTPVPVKGITKTPISGLGDDAVYGQTGQFTELTVKKGDFVFQIKVNGFPVEEVKAKEKTLAQGVLANL